MPCLPVNINFSYFMELLGTVSVKKQTLTFHAAGNQ